MSNWELFTWISVIILGPGAIFVYIIFKGSTRTFTQNR